MDYSVLPAVIGPIGSGQFCMFAFAKKLKSDGEGMKRNSALIKGGTICSLGTLVSIIPSTLGLSAAVASPSISPTMQARTVAFVATTKPAMKKKAVKKKAVKKKVVKKKAPAKKVVKKKAPAKKVSVKKATTKSGTFMGQTAQTQFGPVQVAVTVSAGRITKVTAPIYPTGTYRDQAINSQAIPMLEQEVMQVQSSAIQGIGGASYTSQGFYTSLLSALARAGHK